MFIILFYFTVIYSLPFAVIFSTQKGKRQGPATFCLYCHGQVLYTEDACYTPERSKTLCFKSDVVAHTPAPSPPPIPAPDQTGPRNGMVAPQKCGDAFALPSLVTSHDPQ